MNHRASYLIPKGQAQKIITDARKLAFSEEVDQLDCSISLARQPTTKTVDEVMEIGFRNFSTFYNFIYRAPIGGDEEYFDVGFCTMSARPEYFLWLRLTTKAAQKIIKKYKLKLR